MFMSCGLPRDDDADSGNGLGTCLLVGQPTQRARLGRRAQRWGLQPGCAFCCVGTACMPCFARMLSGLRARSMQAAQTILRSCLGPTLLRC